MTLKVESERRGAETKVRYGKPKAVKFTKDIRAQYRTLVSNTFQLGISTLVQNVSKVKTFFVEEE